MWDPYAGFDSATLPNGLTVHAAHWSERPWICIGFVIHSGAEHDQIGLEGTAHFVEHLVSRNAGMPYRQLCALFEDSGGSAGFGMTGYPETCYWFFAPTHGNVARDSLAAFGKMLLSAKLTQFVEQERAVIENEFHEIFPAPYLYDLAARGRKALHSNDFLGRFVRPLGTVESIRNISQANLQQYYDAHYTPANMSVVAVGGESLGRVIELLSESPFASTKDGSRTPLPQIFSDVPLPTETRHVFKFSEHVRTDLPFATGEIATTCVIPGTVNEQAVRVLAQMCDEILQEEVRNERGWTYGIHPSFTHYRAFYEFLIVANSLSLTALDQIETLIESCLGKVFTREDLFVRVQQGILASNYMLDVTAQGVCSYVCDDLAARQRIVSLKEVASDVEKLTFDDISQLSKWLQPNCRWTLLRVP